MGFVIKFPLEINRVKILFPTPEKKILSQQVTTPKIPLCGMLKDRQEGCKSGDRKGVLSR